MNMDLQPLNKALNMLIEDANFKVEKLNKLYVSCEFDKADKYFDILNSGEWCDVKQEFVHDCDDSLISTIRSKFEKAMGYVETLNHKWLLSICTTLDINIENELRRNFKLNVYTVPGTESSHSWAGEAVEECLQLFRLTIHSIINSYPKGTWKSKSKQSKL
jgi:hypothetical protein